MKTLGISPKVWAPVVLQLIALATTWIASGGFDRVQLAQAITAAGTALVGYLAGPGAVTPAPVGEPSDAVNAKAFDKHLKK